MFRRFSIILPAMNVMFRHIPPTPFPELPLHGKMRGLPPPVRKSTPGLKAKGAGW